jgi:5-formyltetrahydrofolate cyclo-ligase
VSRVEITQAKDVVRRRVWDALEQHRAVPNAGVHGRIPNFHGAHRAADRLAEHPSWQRARIIKAVPDKAQLPVRARALREGKTVYMAVPKLAEPLPFRRLAPNEITVTPEKAASSRTAAGQSRAVAVEDLPPVDLIICGSVAVNQHGVRLGKGAGYSDIEVALLQETGLIGPDTLIATTVHPLQVLDADLPETGHDFKVDLIVTPEEIITCPPSPRPAGILWNHLTQADIDAMPVLATRQHMSR